MLIRFLKYFSFLIIFLLGCASGGFRSPKVITKGNPEYPITAQLERAEGEVLLAVFVNSEGYVEEVEHLSSSGRKDLDAAAVKFAEGLVFKPASLNGNPLSVWTKLVLRFKLTELLFNENRWLFEVFDLRKRIEKESTPQQRERLLKKLYTSYHGLLIHVRKNPNVEINKLIRNVISQKIQNRWYDCWDLHPLAFVVLDDFLERYPKSPVTTLVKERLVKELIDLRYELALDSVSSSSTAKRHAKLMQAIEKRLQTLGAVIPAQT